MSQCRTVSGPKCPVSISHHEYARSGASERFRKWGYKSVRTLYNLVVKVFAENFDISRIFDLAGTGGTSPELGGYNVPRGLLHTGH